MTKSPELGADRYKDLVHARYLITKHTHTSYNETGDITPLERRYIFEFITDELQKQKEAYENLKRDKGRS